MKKIAIAMAVLLLLCGCEKGAEMPAEISEASRSVTTTAAKAAEIATASETTVTTVETTAVTTTETTVPTETTAEETTVTETKLPEPIIPPEALKIDVGSLYKDEKYKFSYTILDSENILVLYHFKNGDSVSAKAGIFSLSDGAEKVNINIPDTDADTFFVRDNAYFDDENILCKIYGCEQGTYADEYTCLSETTVYTDYKYNSSARGRYGFWDEHTYKLPGGRRITESVYGNIRETDSGKLLLNAVFDGDENKSNINYSYAFPIDENRFVYSMWGYEWSWGFGIYDFTTGTARDVPDIFDYRPMGYHDGKIYSYYCTHDGLTDNILYVTDINTLETTPFHKFENGGYEYMSDYDCVYDYEMSPNGEFLLKLYDNKIILYSTDTLEVVKEYEFKNTYIIYWYIRLTEDGKAVLTDDKQKCLYILDLNK